MDAGIVTDILLPSHNAPSFGLPILRAAPQSNARYIQLVDLGGRLQALEPCHPPLEDCIPAPTPYVSVEVGTDAVHAIMAPDRAIHVGVREDLKPVVLGWLDEVSHPMTRLAFAEFAGAQAEAESSAATALAAMSAQAGDRIARRWYLDAVVRPHVHRAVLQRSADIEDVAYLERLVALTEMEILDGDLRVTFPAELERDLKIDLVTLGGQFEVALRYLRALAVRGVLVDVRAAAPSTWRNMRRPSLPEMGGQSCSVLIVGDWDLFAACSGHKSRAAAIDEHGETVAVHVRADGASVIFIRTLGMVGRVLGDLVERSLPAGHGQSILILHAGGGESVGVDLGSAIEEVRGRALELEPKRSLEVCVAVVPERIDDRHRVIERDLARLGVVNSVLSLANAWTPRLRAGWRGRSGSPARLAECVEAWIAAFHSGALQQWRRRRKSKSTSLIISAALTTGDNASGLDWIAPALANPLWPAGRGTDVLLFSERAPIPRREPMDEQPTRRTRFREVYIEAHPQPSMGRARPPTCALAVIDTAAKAGAPAEYVADALTGFGWEVEPDPAGPEPTGVLIRRPGISRRLEVMTSFELAERWLSSEEAGPGDIVVVTESHGGIRPNIFSFETLPQLLKLLSGRRDQRVDTGFAADMARLPHSEGLALSGASIDPASVLPASLARRWLDQEPAMARRVLTPLVSGRDVARFPEGRWAVNFAGLGHAEAQEAGSPYQFVMDQKRGRPGRHGDRLPAVPERISALGLEPTYLVTASVSKHRTFIRCRGVLALTNSVVIVRETAPWMLALLSSSVHRIWSEAMGGRRSGVARYTVRAFETFPWPLELLSGRESHVAKELARLGDELAYRRMEWQFTGITDVGDRLSADFLTSLTHHFSEEEWRGDERDRTLTRLYDRPPTWFGDLSAQIDALVLKAYDLPPHASPDHVLAHLAGLNRTQALSADPWLPA